jgi:integrase
MSFSIASRRTCWKAELTSGRVQEVLGHKDVSTTTEYTHVLNRGAMGVRSPADDLPPKLAMRAKVLPD